MNTEYKNKRIEKKIQKWNFQGTALANILRKEEENLNKRINMWKEIKEDKKYIFGIKE